MYHSVAIQGNGTLWGWGDDTDRELGVPTSSAEPLLIYSPTGPLPVVQSALRNQVSLSVYPTIAVQDYLTYVYSGIVPSSGATLEIINWRGQRVRVLPMASVRGHVSVADLASGWYLLRLITDQHRLVAKFYQP